MRHEPCVGTIARTSCQHVKQVPCTPPTRKGQRPKDPFMMSELTPRKIVQPDDRLFAIHHLARALFEARGDVQQIFQVLASCLTTSFCDGCAIVPAPEN